MAPIKILNSPCRSGKEFFCTLASAGLTPEAIFIMSRLCRATAQYLHRTLCHPCFVSISYFTTFILSTSLSAAKIQGDFTEESYFNKLTSELFVSLWLHVLPFHFSMYTWKSHDVFLTSKFIARFGTWWRYTWTMHGPLLSQGTRSQFLLYFAGAT